MYQCTIPSAIRGCASHSINGCKWLIKKKQKQKTYFIPFKSGDIPSYSITVIKLFLHGGAPNYKLVYIIPMNFSYINHKPQLLKLFINLAIIKQYKTAINPMNNPRVPMVSQNFLNSASYGAHPVGPQGPHLVVVLTHTVEAQLGTDPGRLVQI